MKEYAIFIDPESIEELYKALNNLEDMSSPLLATIVTSSFNQEVRKELLQYQLDSKHTIFCYFTRPDYIRGYLRFMQENKPNVTLIVYRGL